MFEQLRHFIERNRADNLHIKSGWYERLQIIYVHHDQLKPDSSELHSKPVQKKHATGQ